jgi:integrase
MEILLNDNIRGIISAIGNPDKRDSSYVFTIVPNGLASTAQRRTKKEKTIAERIDEIIRQKIKMVNERLKKLCMENDLAELKLTTNWARHTYASLLKEAGESVEMIRELLGHSDIKTTESYLKRFDLKTKQAANSKIAAMVENI